MTGVVEELSAQLSESLNASVRPEVGLHTGIPDGVYHELWRDCVSHSGLRALDISPMHFLAARANPRVETDAQTIGRILHITLLQPHLTHATMQRGPEGNWTLKANREKVEALRTLHPRATVLHPKDYDDINAARDAVLAHPTAGKLVTDAWGYEVSAVWDHAEVENVRCKARADILRPDLGCIVDLKKTVRATPRNFARSVSEYDYTMQAALYLDGFNRVFDPKEPEVFSTFAFIAIEDTAPYGVSVFEIRPEDIEAGRRRYMRLLRRYADCARKDEWPSYPTEVRWLDLPEWTRTRED